jgi:transposase
MSTHSLYAWVKRYSKPEKQRVQEDDQQAELRRLRAELKRETEERDILKNRLPGAPRPIGLETRPLH